MATSRPYRIEYRPADKLVVASTFSAEAKARTRARQLSEYWEVQVCVMYKSLCLAAYVEGRPDPGFEG